MDDLVVPCAGVFRDNNIRERHRASRSWRRLKTAFDKSERGTLTAANSTPLTDGAAAVLLASEEWATKRGLPVQAYLTYAQTAANDFVAGDGLLMAPTIAVSKMLERAGLTLQDFDFYEIHEAFAAQVLATLKAWEDPGLLQGRARPRRAARLDRSREAERAGARPSPSAIRSRRPARASSATSPSCSRSITAARAHLDLHRRRHGRRRDPRIEGRRRARTRPR